MIGSVRGKIELFDGQVVLIDVNGVGYRVHIPTALLANLHLGQEVKFFTHTHVREDQLELFGFNKIEDLKLFELLIGVSGVGPKTALGIFSIGTREQILSAIKTAEVKFFTRVPRLGIKNAQKIIIDLKGKLGSMADLDLSGKNLNEEAEVVQALKSFGFSEKEIQIALEAIGDQKLDTQKKIKMALKYLGK